LAASTTTSSPYLQPALIGGVVMGVLSALPIISAGNICCCLWVISGGVVAAYLFQQHHTTAMTPSDGALVGLLAGLVGAVVVFVLSIPIDLLIAPMELAMVQRILDNGALPPEAHDMLERYGRGGGLGAGFFIIRKIFSLMMWAFVGGIFSTLGGLLGALIFKTQTPPGIIDVPPTA
jgi:Family of unknown function (DUF5518)